MGAIAIFLTLVSLLFPNTECQTIDMPIPESIGNADDQQSGVYDHTLHVVISAPEFVIDEFATGQQVITLDGTASHTHEPGAKIVKYQWTKGDIVLSTLKSFDWLVKFAFNTICLTIFDDKNMSLKDCKVVKLVKPCNLPGTEIAYFPKGTAFNNLAGSPQATEFLKNYQLLGETAYPAPFVARFRGTITFTTAKQILVSKPSLKHEIIVDNKTVANNALIQAGARQIELRVAIDAYEQLPFSLFTNGNVLFPNAWLKFDATGNGCGTTPSPPPGSSTSLVINTISPAKGPTSGGNIVTLTTNSFNTANVQVLVNGKVVTANVQTGKTTFTMPAGTGVAKVQLKKDTSTSSVKEYTYTSSNPVYKDATLASGDFVVVEYCYGFLFTAEYGGPTVRGKIQQWTVNSDYTVTKVKDINVVNTSAPDGANTVLGLVCDPFMNANNFQIYVHHAKLYQTPFFTVFPITGNPLVSYKGYVSKISSTDGFSKLTGVLSGLPVSNRDHSVNGGDFLDDQTLLICVGGMTNQGYPGKLMGGLPESPLAGAILQSKVRTITTPQKVSYKWIPGYESWYPSNADPNNAIYGDAVEPTTTVVTTYATGLRNPYDCVVTLDNKVFCTDNGSNPGGYGNTQTGCVNKNGKLDYQVAGEDPNQQKDEIVQLFKGSHYGHPNMARVRKAGTCTAQGKYTPGGSFSTGVTAPTASVSSSVDGIFEFTSYVFDGDKKGQLFACKYKQALYELSSTGNFVNTDFSAPCLDIVGGPGGAMYMVDQGNDNVLKVRYPVGGVGAWDVFPHRGTPGVNFILSGNGFSTTGTTTVTFGTLTATSVKVVNPRRITGNAPNIKGLVDITVNNDGKLWKIPKGYKGL